MHWSICTTVVCCRFFGFPSSPSKRGFFRLALLTDVHTHTEAGQWRPLTNPTDPGELNWTICSKLKLKARLYFYFHRGASNMDGFHETSKGVVSWRGDCLFNRIGTQVLVVIQQRQNSSVEPPNEISVGGFNFWLLVLKSVSSVTENWVVLDYFHNMSHRITCSFFAIVRYLKMP